MKKHLILINNMNMENVSLSLDCESCIYQNVTLTVIRCYLNSRYLSSALSWLPIINVDQRPCKLGYFIPNFFDTLQKILIDYNPVCWPDLGNLSIRAWPH